MALGLLVPQLFTVSVILLVTSVTFMLLLWRSTWSFSTGQHMGIIPILAEGLPTVRTWGCPPLMMLLKMLIEVTLAVVRSTTFRPIAGKFLSLWVMCSLVEF